MSFYVYNILFTAIVSIGVIGGIIVYFVLLHRHLRDLQQTIMLEIERLRITIAQVSYPSGRAGKVQPEELVDADREEEVAADVSLHEEGGGLGPLAEQADAGEGEGSSSITQPS